MQQRKYLILTADDNRAIVELLGELLREEGYETVGCFSGDETYTFVKRSPPDLLILDMQMERRDTGLQILQLIRSNPTIRQMPIIMCSADELTLQSLESQLHELRCTTVVKPFQIDGLLRQIELALKPEVA